MKLMIKNGAINIDGNTILDYINFEINEHSKIGITGLNGTGKSTFLKALNDQEMFSEGIGDEKFQITKIGNFNVGYISQINDQEDKTLEEYIYEVFEELIKIEHKIEKISKNMDSSLSDKYNDLLNKYKIMGGYTYKKEYEIMLKKFGFLSSDKKKKIASFSGGEKSKISFMKLLLSKPELLILDEPTNNLDIETIEWLEEYLKNYKYAFIIVSHDRTFLNSLVDTIYDIEYGEIKKYVGNYDHFEEEKQKNYLKLKKDYEYQQKEIKRLEEIYEKYRCKPTKANMALSKLKQIERMKIIAKPNEIDQSVFKAKINDFEQSSKIVLRMNNLSIGYEFEMFLVDTEIKRGDKVAIIGQNGVGKSTLIKTISGYLTPLNGDISYGLQVKPAYFDQNLTFSNVDYTVLEIFKHEIIHFSEFEARSYLAQFLFKGEDVNKNISVLSGGEKVRLKLALMFVNKPNFLILDEVTNHVDLVTKKYLEELFSNYKGTIIFISHDRHFIDSIANRIIFIQENSVNYFDGNYSEYKNKISLTEEVKEIKNEENKKNDEVKKVNKYELKKDINRIENEIVKIETKIKELENSTFERENYQDISKLTTINQKIATLKEELSVKNKKWEELFEQYEKGD